ncbi:MAG: hypothetical protein IT205_04850 [Fimbriimonadaceae bacterium]|nr:hypothetical protein [Fimbriimonadaceae bacterium]
MGYAEPVKGKNTLLWIILGLAGFCILLCALGGFFGFRFFQGVAGKAVNMVACSVDLQAARAAIKKYAEAHNGKLPPARTWQDSVKQYFKTERDKLEESDIEEARGMGIDVKLSDPDGVWGCRLDGGKIQAFVFNEELGDKKISDIKDPSSKILLWEDTASGRNLMGKYIAKKPNADMAIMGEKREFLKINVEGEFHMQGTGRKRRVKVEVGE